MKMSSGEMCTKAGSTETTVCSFRASCVVCVRCGASCVVGWGVSGGDCRCLKGLQLFWCPTCCLTAGREGPVSRISLWAGFSHQEIFPIGGKFFPNRGTFLISVGEFFRSAGHFSCRWDIFPVDRRQNFREGHGNPVCRSPQRAELLKTPGNRGPQGEGFSPEHGERPRQDMLRLRGTLVLPLAEARSGEWAGFEQNTDIKS